jgi:hypothetical protein
MTPTIIEIEPDTIPIPDKPIPDYPDEIEWDDEPDDDNETPNWDI